MQSTQWAKLLVDNIFLNELRGSWPMHRYILHTAISCMYMLQFFMFLCSLMFMTEASCTCVVQGHVEWRFISHKPHFEIICPLAIQWHRFIFDLCHCKTLHHRWHLLILLLSNKLTVNQLHLMDHVAQKAERHYFDQCQVCTVSWNAYILVSAGT